MNKKLLKMSIAALAFSSLVGCDDNSKSTYLVTAKNDLVYNGNEQTLINAISTEFGTYYFSLDNTMYTTEVPKAKDSGTYDIYYYSVGNEKYESIGDIQNPKKITSNISKRDISEEMFTAPKSENVETGGLDVELFDDGICDYGTFKYSFDKEEWCEDTLLVNSSGEYDAYWYIEGDDNHNDYASKEDPKKLTCNVKDSLMLASNPLANQDVKLKEYRIHDTYDGANTYSDDATFEFAFSDLVDLDNETYSKNLSTFGLLLTAELYDYVTVERKIGENAYTDKRFIETIGVKDITISSPEIQENQKDKNDIATVELSHVEFVYKNALHQEFFITFKGTDKSEEWASNFDIGYDCDDYITESNPHSEWTNKNHHKGFDVAFNRVRTFIDKYIADNKTSSGETIMFISGHSRGGAMANLAGAYYTKNTTYKVFDYTFASPNVTDEENIYEYKNIFNIVNEDDLIASIPPSSFGFKRYGTTMSYKISSDKNVANEFLNKTYTSVDVSGLLNILESLFESREALYLMPDDYADAEAYQTYSSEAAAYHGLELMKSDLGDLCNKGTVIIDNPTLINEKWTIRWRYSKAFILDTIGELMVSENPLMKLALLLYIPTPLNELGTKLITVMADTSGISCSHLPDSYVLVINNL